ncbi:MAG: CRISPR-associated endoribonuclease Cas6 [Candidatus Caldatribacteriaceae bacterium]
MRLRIQFEVAKVPLLYRNAFMSYCKEALRSSPSGEKRFQELFHYRNHRTNKAPKPFCFAVRFLHVRESFEREKECFTLISPLGFYFSTLDPGLFVDFYNGVINRSLYPFQKGDFTLNYPISTTFLPERPITRDTALFQTLSPILIEDSCGKPLLPLSDTEKFIQELNYQTNVLLQGTRGESLKRELLFQPIAVRKEVVKHAIRERDETSRVYTFTCFSGQFLLQGHPQDLRDIQVLGLGRRRSQGFGMVEVVKG